MVYIRILSGHPKKELLRSPWVAAPEVGRHLLKGFGTPGGPRRKKEHRPLFREGPQSGLNPYPSGSLGPKVLYLDCFGAYMYIPVYMGTWNLQGTRANPGP